MLGLGLSSAAQELPAIGDLQAPSAAGRGRREHVQFVSEEAPVLPAGRQALVLRLRLQGAMTDFTCELAPAQGGAAGCDGR